jgi:O-antigen ligase
LYEKLGSGRDQLTRGNIFYLIENPQVIPFGMGFVNRFNTAPGLSAHNMYLQVIKELGLVGFFIYFGWLIQYLVLDFKQNKGFSIALKGLVLAMLVALYFGEHLYIYRPLFGILGLFLAITSIFVSILHRVNIDTK